MNELLLQTIWEKQFFDSSDLRLSDGSNLKIIDKGYWNKNSGPDFSCVKIKINDILWFGDMEVHLKSSDWIRHKHLNDRNYDKVILHVVWNDDNQIIQNNFKIPTINMSKSIDTTSMSIIKKWKKN